MNTSAERELMDWLRDLERLCDDTLAHLPGQHIHDRVPVHECPGCNPTR